MIPQRVTMVCSSTTWGGTEKWALRAAEQLQARNIEVTFTGRSPELFARFARFKMPFLQLPFVNEADIATVLRLAVHLRSQDAVILTRVRDYWLGGLAARIAGTPSLLRLGVVRHLRNHYWMDRLRYGLLPSAVLVNARPIANALQRTPWMRSLSISMISNGVDAPGAASAEEKAEARTALSIPNNVLLIIGTGRLAMEKRWPLLVHAVAELKKRGLSVQGVLLGEGDQRGSLEQLIGELDVWDQITLPGHTTDIDRWLSAADIFAQPSENEGLSNSLLEAMGRGLACVSTATGGVRDHFSDGSELLIANAEDETGFIDRVVHLAEDPLLRAEVAGNGLQSVRQHFTWERMTDRLIEVLDNMTGGRK
ncbi:MAG: glycosyltransferase family 4 protein [bacterium]